jgi:hypothetical protein
LSPTEPQNNTEQLDERVHNERWEGGESEVKQNAYSVETSDVVSEDRSKSNERFNGRNHRLREAGPRRTNIAPERIDVRGACKIIETKYKTVRGKGPAGDAVSEL